MSSESCSPRAAGSTGGAGTRATASSPWLGAVEAAAAKTRRAPAGARWTEGAIASSQARRTDSERRPRADRAPRGLAPAGRRPRSVAAEAPAKPTLPELDAQAQLGVGRGRVERARHGQHEAAVPAGERRHEAVAQRPGRRPGRLAPGPARHLDAQVGALVERHRPARASRRRAPPRHGSGCASAGRPLRSRSDRAARAPRRRPARRRRAGPGPPPPRRTAGRPYSARRSAAARPRPAPAARARRSRRGARSPASRGPSGAGDAERETSQQTGARPHDRRTEPIYPIPGRRTAADGLAPATGAG